MNLKQVHALAFPVWWIAALALTTEAIYLCYNHGGRLYWILLTVAVFQLLVVGVASFRSARYWHGQRKSGSASHSG